MKVAPFTREDVKLQRHVEAWGAEIKELHEIWLKTTIISFRFNLSRKECLAVPSSVIHVFK